MLCADTPTRCTGIPLRIYSGEGYGSLSGIHTPREVLSIYEPSIFSTDSDASTLGNLNSYSMLWYTLVEITGWGNRLLDNIHTPSDEFCNFSNTSVLLPDSSVTLRSFSYPYPRVGYAPTEILNADTSRGINLEWVWMYMFTSDTILQPDVMTTHIHLSQNLDVFTKAPHIHGTKHESSELGVLSGYAVQ